jgi:hypothetical protein
MENTPERIERVRMALQVHRGRGDAPDERIICKILGHFDGDESLSKWLADIEESIDPAELTSDGYAFYEGNARMWAENGGRRVGRKQKPKSRYTQWDGKSDGYSPSVTSTMDPETRRRIKERDRQQKQAVVPPKAWVKDW